MIYWYIVSIYQVKWNVNKKNLEKCEKYEIYEMSNIWIIILIDKIVFYFDIKFYDYMKKIIIKSSFNIISKK